MTPIIVPVNDSDGAANAARYAADLALAIQADLCLVHALQVPVSVAEVPATNYVFEQMQENAVALLESLQKDLIARTRNQVVIKTDIEIGGVAYMLEEYCKRKNPFLVVMGASTDSLEALLAGGTTIKAMKLLSYPVLVVPEKASFHAISKIVLACDEEYLGPALTAFLPFFNQLHNLFASRFEVIHVSRREEKNEQEAQFQFESWKQRMKEMAPQIQFVHAEDVAGGIHQYLDNNKADWLIVFPHSHGLLDFHISQSKKIAKASPIPVISLHR